MENAVICVWEKIWKKKNFGNFEPPKMVNSKEVEILGIKIDRKWSFHQNIKSISKKAGQKLGALLRISPYLKDK